MAWYRPGDNHYLNQWWLVYWRIYRSLGPNESIIHRGFVIVSVEYPFLLKMKNSSIYMSCMFQTNMSNDNITCQFGLKVFIKTANLLSDDTCHIWHWIKWRNFYISILYDDTLIEIFIAVVFRQGYTCQLLSKNSRRYSTLPPMTPRTIQLNTICQNDYLKFNWPPYASFLSA